MADKRADQLKEITERLEQGVKDIFTSEMYTKYLLTMSKFHNYSFNNTLLIAMQRPDATLVAGYNAWKNKFNRYVKKGEKGIQIIAPAPVKEREEREKIDKDTGLTVLNESGEPEIEVVERVIPRFRVTTVFDYAQTDGEPLPTLEVNELTARVKDYTLLKEAIEQVSPVPIRFGEIEGNAKGYYSHVDKEICVRADMGESQTIKTMIHEVAHAMLHDSDQMKQRGEEKDQLTKETEAESIAFTVCSALGIDTSDYSFPYVASWASGKELKELKDSMDTIRLTAADFLEKLETAVAERSVERMTAMEYAEKLIADKERDKTVFDNSQRNLIVNFAYKLDDRAATEELANNLAAAVAAENTEEINRLMWEAEEKIESLPDGMIGLSEMHEYGYLKDDVLPLTKEGAREWHRLGERIYPLFQDGTAGDFASQEEIEQHDGIFGIKADAWSAILLEKNEEYLEDEYARPDAALTVISREQALRLFDEGKQIYLIRISPWPVLVTGREEIERGSDYFQIAKEDLEKDKQKAMENSEKAPVEKLAADLDEFAFDFDFYHYKDSVEDREQAVEALKEQIQAGDVQPIREWLQDAVEESEGESAEKAAELITRLDALVKEQKLLSGSEKQFGIYQITARDQEHDYRFMNLDFVKRHGMEVNRADYELVYTAPLTEKDTLEAIYERFNIQRPADFTGHSLSVSDVVVLNDGKSIKACYVDSIGFAELPDFFKERKIDLQKETILDEQLQEIEIFDKPGLFSNGRLRDEDVPEGLYRYDLRGSDYDPGQPILVEKTVIVNHAASVLMAEELDLGADGRLELGEEGLNFTGGLLTVREFMKEQEEKNNGLLHGDSYNITVEGHIGTWYAIDETEVNGEKFFLLEHEEYGDEAACVAVNEQGKLVAEDLWNGFDEDFQDAVKEYFAEKNPAFQKEAQAVPVAEESRMDNSDVPVYYESFSYAAENGEVDLYRISRQLNEECRNAIEEAIADNFDGMHLADDATKSVVEQFGMERMGYILAYTLNYNNHDGRYSHSNKEWADTTCKGERGSNIRTGWIVRSHPAVLNGFVNMYRKELAVEQQREPEKPFVQQFYVVTDLQTNPMKIEKFGNLDDAMFCYQQVPNFHLKALGVEKTPDPLPGSLDIVQCKNGIDTIVEDYKKVPGWDNPYIQNHVVALVAEALKVQDVAVAYEINDGYFHIQTSEDGCDYTLYNKDFTVMDGGIIEVDGYRPVQEVMEEVLAEHGHSVSECGVISAEYLQEQSYRAETQRAEAMKEKLAAEKPAPEASISFYVAECAEFPVMGEFHDNLTLEQALEVYDKIPAERMNGIKSIGFSLEDGSIYSGMFDLMVGGEVQAEVVNHIQHYRESPLVQKAISDMKTLLEKRQASKELEERPNIRQSVREALKNRKKAQEQQPNQEQVKPKKAKKKGEMEL
ncbi:DUF3849 domain-containing protein [uncultured Faecalibacterium sp.]|jgi:antirestriction protein ArdC/uncharacterized protein YpmB|uniref:DUF3849 domain-containing protein n=1 Tax=uncultured Faecalibacterium sp. TaxID=259315 RepID=UPI002804F0C3|nr:DUF3849 domain-containing protein [uncultured Faecalibacterium sp.]